MVLDLVTYQGPLSYSDSMPNAQPAIPDSLGWEGVRRESGVVSVFPKPRPVILFSRFGVVLVL